MAKINLRLANAEDVKTLYGKLLAKSFYGITAADDSGKAIGIAGFYFYNRWVLFAHVTDELRKHPIVIWRAAKELIKAMKHLDEPIYAVADPSIDGSDRLLKRMGFAHLSKDWYEWLPRQ